MKYFLYVLLFFAQAASAQFHIPIAPELSGTALLNHLKNNYKPGSLLPESPARDTLFSVIYGQNDSLTCVYTGYTIWLDPTKDPTQAAFDFDINTEHTYPKSLGATGVAEGDMHHLYATRADVNNARANSPFAEIPDNETEEWYYKDMKVTAIPASNIDLYSERKGELFEPREDHKGNVARAMFYFYTMYKEQADQVDPNFFESQRETLCAWHLLDPVDQNEWDRTWLIAHFQGGKPNPFVLDCTLPERSYCAGFGQVCTPTASSVETGRANLFSFKVHPNPFRKGTTFAYALQKPGKVSLEIFSIAGERIENKELGHLGAGEHSFFWEGKNGLPTGLYYYKLSFSFDGQHIVVPGKMLLIR